MNFLSRATNNPHTSIAALVFICAKGFAVIGSIWFPSHKDQFQQTAQAIEGIAGGYGLLMAGDAKQSAGAKSDASSAMPPLKDTK